MSKDFYKATPRNVTLENTVIPLFRKKKTIFYRAKNLYEIEKELRWKIYTNLYSYNTTCEGIFFSKGINDINGFRNCGKTSMCSHICVNLFFNDLLHFFHLFYTTYICFEKLLEKKNLKNKYTKKFSINLKREKKKFSEKNKSFDELQEVIEYLVQTFIKKYGKEKDSHEDINEETNLNGRQNEKSIKQNIRNKTQEPNQFDKKKVIYLDLDGGFYIERYNNMIRSTINRMQNLMKTYLQFVSEKKCVLYLLLLDNKKLKKKLLQINKNYEEHIFFIDLFNYYLQKLIADISFNEVLAQLQILKIFNFNELVNTIAFISTQMEKYYVSYSYNSFNNTSRSFRFPEFNKYVLPDLGMVVVDNLYYLYKGNEYNASLKNQLLFMLKHLSLLSTRYKVCILVTNNYDRSSKMCDELFNQLYSPYVCNRVLLKFLNKKQYYEHNYHEKETRHSGKGNGMSYSSDDEKNKITEDHHYQFCAKRFNSRYIQVEKKRKTYSFFFEINTQGIQMIMD